MEYMINRWTGDGKNSCACMLRTQDKKLWRAHIDKLKKEYNISNFTAQIVERPELTIFSFFTKPQNGDTTECYTAWRMRGMFGERKIIKPFR